MFLNTLLWIHILSLIVLLGFSFALSIIARVASSAEEGATQNIWSVYDQLDRLLRISVVVVFISGPLLLWQKYGLYGLPGWFWIKMAFLAALLINLVIGLRAVKTVRGGDASALGAMKRFSVLEIVFSAGIVISAVFAFN